jgi:ribosomal protein S18 acetylase RimI-like enzyme
VIELEIREGDRFNDLPLMQGIASSALAAGGPRYTVHPGDLAWWVYHQDPRRADSTSYWLWEDRGFIAFDGSEISAFTLPGEDVIPLVEWSRERAGQSATVAWVSSADRDLEEYLRRHGWRRTDPMRAFERKTAQSRAALSEPAPGWELRPLRGEEEANARREASHGAFASTMDPEQHLQRYLRFMRSPVYDRERDLVAVAPDGRIAAFLIWWPDRSGIAQIEPLGTHPDFQRQGWGRALVEFAVARMADAGMHTVRVCTEETRVPASSFYPAAGFTQVGSLGWWNIS